MNKKKVFIFNICIVISLHAAEKHSSGTTRMTVTSNYHPMGLDNVKVQIPPTDHNLHLNAKIDAIPPIPPLSFNKLPVDLKHDLEARLSKEDAQRFHGVLNNMNVNITPNFSTAQSLRLVGTASAITSLTSMSWQGVGIMNTGVTAASAAMIFSDNLDKETIYACGRHTQSCCTRFFSIIKRLMASKNVTNIHVATLASYSTTSSDPKHMRPNTAAAIAISASAASSSDDKQRN